MHAFCADHCQRVYPYINMSFAVDVQIVPWGMARHLLAIPNHRRRTLKRSVLVGGGRAKYVHGSECGLERRLRPTRVLKRKAADVHKRVTARLPAQSLDGGELALSCVHHRLGVLWRSRVRQWQCGDEEGLCGLGVALVRQNTPVRGSGGSCTWRCQHDPWAVGQRYRRERHEYMKEELSCIYGNSSRRSHDM